VNPRNCHSPPTCLPLVIDVVATAGFYFIVFATRLSQLLLQAYRQQLVTLAEFVYSGLAASTERILPVTIFLSAQAINSN
jgi:hypothetical protein